MTLTTPKWAWFVILRLILDVAYLCTKFENSTFTHYRDEGDLKCKKWGDLGPLPVKKTPSQLSAKVLFWKEVVEENGGTPADPGSPGRWLLKWK